MEGQESISHSPVNLSENGMPRDKTMSDGSYYPLSWVLSFLEELEELIEGLGLRRSLRMNNRKVTGLLGTGILDKINPLFPLQKARYYGVNVTFS